MNRDFNLVVIGQIVSLFGNSILRFALPLYILELSGSPALFGTILAVSSIPLIIMSPIGGVMADRVNKKWIMVILDFITATCILFYFWVSGFAPVIPSTVVIMMALFTIQGMYGPTVDASIPSLVEVNQLVRANSIVFLVANLSGMAGPAIGGILFAAFGLSPILLISAVCFTLAAFRDKLRIQKSHWLLFACTFSLLPVCAAFYFNLSIISICLILTVMLSLLAQPVGQFLFGVLFEQFSDSPWIVILFSLLPAAIISLCSRKIFKGI